MRISALKKCICELFGRVKALEGKSDLDNQTLSLDSCDLSISNWNTVTLPMNNYVAYKMSEPTVWVNVRNWLEAPVAVAHDDVANIWTWPIDSETNFPSHPNAPTAQVVDNNFSYAGASDQYEAWSYIQFDVPTWIRDNNSNTGERGEVWIAECCGAPRLLQRTTVDTLNPTWILDAVLIPAWTHLLYVRQSDLSANQGFNLQESPDNVAWSNYSWSMWIEKPVVECIEVEGCDELPEGYSLCPPETCTPKFGLPEVSEEVEVPIASTSLPIADNEVDTAIRTGQVWVSDDFARADHNHPIRRQTLPADPTPVAAGSFTELQNIVLDRGSDEESVWYRYRVRVSQTAWNSWGWIQVPTIAWFQQPIYMELSWYMSTTVVVQEDDWAFGATPRGQWMGYPIHHWSSSNRLYGGIFRRDNDITSLYVNFVVKYTRT